MIPGKTQGFTTLASRLGQPGDRRMELKVDRGESQVPGEGGGQGRLVEGHRVDTVHGPGRLGTDRHLELVKYIQGKSPIRTLIPHELCKIMPAGVLAPVLVGAAQEYPRARLPPPPTTCPRALCTGPYGRAKPMFGPAYLEGITLRFSEPSPHAFTKRG